MLRGQIKFEGVWQFMTALACAYPPQLGQLVGEAVAEGVKVRREELHQGGPVPLMKLEEDMGNPMLQALCDRRGNLLEKSYKWCEDGVPDPEEEVQSQESDETLEPNSGGAKKNFPGSCSSDSAYSSASCAPFSDFTRFNTGACFDCRWKLGPWT